MADRFRKEQRRLLRLHRAIRDGTVDDRQRRNRTRMIKARFGALLRRGQELPDAKLQTLCRELDRLCVGAKIRWPA
jgi:hypothetical protein